MRDPYDRAKGRVFHRSDPGKAAIMRLFNASDYDIFAAGFIFDVVSGEETDMPLAAIGRDGFSRSNEDAYYFERYDMELTPELREYALAHAPKA